MVVWEENSPPVLLRQRQHRNRKSRKLHSQSRIVSVHQTSCLLLFFPFDSTMDCSLPPYTTFLPSLQTKGTFLHGSARLHTGARLRWSTMRTASSINGMRLWVGSKDRPPETKILLLPNATTGGTVGRLFACPTVSLYVFSVCTRMYPPVHICSGGHLKQANAAACP